MNNLARVSALVWVLSIWAPSVTAAETPVLLQQATATFSQSPNEFYGVARAIDFGISPDRGWAIDGAAGSSQTAVFETTADAGFAAGSLFTFTLSQTFLGSGGQFKQGRFRLSVTNDDRSLFADGLQSGGDVTANWNVLSPTTVSSQNGATLSVLSDQSILASGTSPTTDVYVVTAATSLTGITGIRLEALTDASLPFGGPGRQPFLDNFVLNQIDVTVAVPEPEAYALMLVGLGLVGYAARRRKRA